MVNTLKLYKVFSRLLGALGALIVLSRCGDAPPTPTLPGHSPNAADRILLDDKIEASDIRQIFAAMNQDGQLESIRSWFDKTSDADLNSIGKVITRFFYQSAHEPDGAIALLRERTANRSFTKGLALTREWAAGNRAPSMSSLAKAAMKSSFWLDVVERDIGFLSPDLDASLAELQSDFQKAWDCQDNCPVPTEPVSASQIVADMTRFLTTDGLKGRWVELCSSLTDSWPIVGFLHGLREVNQRYSGRAFDGMGEGLSRMIREPKNPAKGSLPTQFDTLMDLMLALNGPSDGLFSAVNDKLTENKELAREIGTILQPNVPGRVLNYAPILPNTHFGILVGELKDPKVFTREDWLALGADRTSQANKDAFEKFFVASRTAHEMLTGAPHDPGSDDYVLFDLPLYLNNYVLSEWAREALTENRAALEKLPKENFASAVWSVPVSVKAFSYDFTHIDAKGEPVFVVDKIDALSAFGLSDFALSLSHNSPAGLGGFHYTVPATHSVPLRDAMRSAIEALDQTRGFADGSSLLRTAIAFLIRPNGGGKSFLQGLETDDLLLSAHRMLASMPKESWKTLRSLFFDGLAIDDMPEETKKMLLGFYEDHPVLQKRFSRILDSAAMLKKLDATESTEGVSAFEAYHEVVRETGPREWRALSEAWVFVAQSGLFALDGVGGIIAPRFPSAYARLSHGDASGIFRLAAQVQPSRHRPLADFFNEAMREKTGLRGSEVHWDFLHELVQQSPDGMAALWDSYRDGNWSGSRSTLTAKERSWMVHFVREGAFRDVWKVFGDRFMGGSPSQWVHQLKELSGTGNLRAGLRMLALVKNDRIREIALALQEWDDSGELKAFLETLDTMWK